MGTIKENYQIMFTTYPDVVTINQLKEMLGIGVTLAYRLVKNNIICGFKVGREYKIPKANIYKQKLKGSTIAHYTSNINTALKEAVIAEIIPSNTMDRIESVKKEVYIPEFYTDDELLDLIEVIKTPNLELPLTLGIIYGLRREE